MRTLAAEPNVVCKLSGLGNKVPKWTEELIRLYVLEAIDIFGIDRRVFASNFPTDGAFSTMRAVCKAFFSIAKSFTAEERDKLFAPTRSGTIASPSNFPKTKKCEASG